MAHTWAPAIDVLFGKGLPWGFPKKEGSGNKNALLWGHHQYLGTIHEHNGLQQPLEPAHPPRHLAPSHVGIYETPVLPIAVTMGHLLVVTRAFSDLGP